jgi:GT2 family glycosyltransferase
LLPRQALDDAGIFDEDYFMYSEEVDLCYRLRQYGYSINWVPQAEVIHYGGQSTRQAAEEMFLRLYQGKVLYFRKHHSGFAVGIYKLILFLASMIRLVLTPLAYLENPTRREKHLKLSNNYLRLIGALHGF